MDPQAAAKRIYATVAVQTVRFLAIYHLPRVSCQSANEDDNEVKLRAVHRFSGIYLQLRKMWENLS